jgi:hypothetical protein
MIHKLDVLVDPNIGSLNRLSEILKKADVLAEEIANIINNIGGQGEQRQALGEVPGSTTSASLLKDRPHASASRTKVARKPKPQGKPAAPEVELIDPRNASRPDRPISRQEPGIPGSDANGSHSADLKPPESTKVEADPGTVGGVQKLLLVSATLMARYNREELYEKVWRLPVRLAAREYGVSDVTIAKVCRKLRIAVPGRGYWAKKAANRPVEPRPPLPVVQIRSERRTGTSRAPMPRTIPAIEEPPRVSRRLLARYDREELYEKVWTLTMQKVAKEYGVSDGTLGITCKKLHVPVPGVGYWNKKAANKPVDPRPPLPQFVVFSVEIQLSSMAQPLLGP